LSSGETVHVPDELVTLAVQSTMVTSPASGWVRVVGWCGSSAVNQTPSPAPTRHRGLPGQHLKHGTPTAAYRALLGEIGVGQTLSGAQPAGPVRYVRGLPNGYLRRPYGPGWALVGDAGHWLDPMSTHGMTSALRDVELAGRVLSGPTGDDPAAPDRWEQYRVERDRLSLPLLRASDAIAAHDWDLHTIRRLLRAMASGMADEVDALTDDRAA